jgi:hypothetical protein
VQLMGYNLLGSCNLQNWISMSRRAPRRPLLRLVGASRNPDQLSSSGGQSNESIPPVILGWHLVHGSPGQLISIRWERKWQRLGLLLNRDVVSPSGMLSGTHHRIQNCIIWWHWITASCRNTYTDLHIDFCTTEVYNKYPVYVFTAVVIS